MNDTTKDSVTDALPERDTTKTAEQQGLFRKFAHGCRYYMLDVDHDPYAAAALGAYADACKESHPELARDLREKWGAADTIDALRAENERLKNEAVIFYEAAAGLLATNDALRDQLAKAQRDAERYNFLAGFNLTVHSPRWGHWHIERWTKDGWEPIYGNLMSAAIDAAKDQL